jgi:hypothetical protein
MTEANDSGDTVPITVRVPRHLVDWLKEKQAAHAKDGLRVSLPTLINQSVERDKRGDTHMRPSGPKKARPHT